MNDKNLSGLLRLNIKLRFLKTLNFINFECHLKNLPQINVKFSLKKVSSISL